MLNMYAKRFIKYQYLIYTSTRRKNVQRTMGSLRLGEEDVCSRVRHDDLTCDECGENFQRPLLATLCSSGQTQKYYACPRCLTEVTMPGVREDREDHRTASAPARGVERAEPKLDEVKCGHFFGYLKRRPKDSPVPEDCLTCGKMIECMIKQ
jgi:hypothetical protein